MTVVEQTTGTCETANIEGSEPTSGGCGQGFLATHLAPVTAAIASLDRALADAQTLDAKTDELLRFALSIKARSEPCVRKHFSGALAAGATEAEIAYVFALTMREAAGADDCWTHGIISDLTTDTATPGYDDDPAGCCG
ncbi:MAG: carboxymuconolactone decarboxylase family protein [Actinomycetia bacterium]|nr:carboxymuconolactone decarboxylase family protein [Actinomycetes bacterium]